MAYFYLHGFASGSRSAKAVYLGDLPCFEWLPRLGEAQVKHWQAQTYLEFYHYGEQCQLLLSYRFIQDLAQYSDDQLQRPVPTLVLHGIHDDIIPIKASRDFVARRPWVRLTELDSDHSLSNVKAKIWEAVKAFCRLA